MPRGDVVYVDFPLIPGSSIQGRRRPAVLVMPDSSKVNNPLWMFVPLTTNLGSGRFPYTVQVDPSPNNHLQQPSIALVFQLCAVDVKFIEKKTGSLDSSDLEKIDQLIKQLLGM